MLVLQVLLAVGLLVAACGEGTGSEDVFDIAIHSEPSSLDPHLQSELTARSVLANIYDPLVAFDIDMNLVPALAESWYSPSDRLWRFRLRPDVYFHDGRPLGVEDVIASLERADRHPRSSKKGAVVGIEALRVADDGSLEIETTDPNPLLLTRLAFVFIVPRDAPEIIHQPMGTGPYRFLDAVGGRIELGLERGNWQGLEEPEKVCYHFVSGAEERFAGLRDGRFDLVNDLRLEDLPAVESDPELRAERRTSFGVTYLKMDPTHPPFDDPRVRRAIDLAIDRRELAHHSHGELAVPVAHMASRDVFGFDPDAGIPSRDLEEARRLLRAAGHGSGLTLTLEVREGIDVEPLRRQLEKLGVRLEVDAKPWSEMYEQLTDRKVGFYLGSWNSSSGDAGEVLDLKLHSFQPAGHYGTANFTHHVHPELDRLIEAGRTLLDTEKRRRALQRALALSAEDRVYLPLYSEHELYGVRADWPWKPRQDSGISVVRVGDGARGPGR